MTMTEEAARETSGETGDHPMVRLYRLMVRIREFETLCQSLWNTRIGPGPKGEVTAVEHMPGFVHLSIGQEAVAVGVCSQLTTQDFIASTHRGHGHVIAKGGDPSRMMAELYGRVTGYCKGKGGSMHITDMSLGMLGANGIVSGGLPIAVGAAYNARFLKRSDQVVGAFFGDGATNEGPFHEAMNMAAAWKLPVVFVCENNYYGVSTRLDRVCRTTDLTVRAGGYAIANKSVDGNDVLAVYRVMKEAVDRARSGGGPTLVEAKTYRLVPHSSDDDDRSYRSREEVEEWKRRDPIPRFRAYLEAESLLTPSEVDAMEARIKEEVEDAVKFATEAPYPEAEDGRRPVYAEEVGGAHA